MALVHRFIADEPSAVFDVESVYRNRKVLISVFHDLAEDLAPLTRGSKAAGWRMDSPVATSAAGLAVAEGRKKLVMTHRLPAGDTSIDRLKVFVVQTRGSVATLEWAALGEDFAVERQLEMRSRPRQRSGTHSFVLDLPQMSKPVARLRLTLRPRKQGELTVQKIYGFARKIDSEGLQKALAQPWKLDLEDEIRAAWLTVPGIDVERTVDIPERAELRFAYALYESHDLPMTYRLRVAPAAAGEQALDTVFEATLDPAVEYKGGPWHEAEVDLQKFAGKAARIVFETSSSKPIDGFDGFAVWANPTLFGGDESAGRPNVILISIDTLRADRMSVYGYQRPTTPHLEAWAKSSAAVFDSAIAQAPWTLPSHTSMLSGLNAFRHGVNHSSPAPPSLDLLAEQLRPHGYATMAVSGGGFVHPDYGLGQGFDRFRYWADSTSPRAQEFQIGLATAIDWLEASADHPFFLFFHTYEVHHRTRPRKHYFEQFSDLEPDWRLRLLKPEPTAEDGWRRSRQYALQIKAEDGSGEITHEPLPEELRDLPGDIYDSGIALADQGLSTLLAKVSELGLEGRTIILLTSDHGEMLGEHGDAGHVYLWDENLRVPLMLAAPGVTTGGQQIAQQVRSIDIVPTLLDLVDLEPRSPVDGQSLVPLLTGEASDHPDEAWSYASVSNRGISLRVRNQVKYTFTDSVWPPHNGEEKVFDLRQDPNEQTNLVEQYGRLEPMRQQLREAMEQHLGLRLRLINDSDIPYEVTVRGPAVRQGATKSVDLACDCVTWIGNGRAQVLVPAETSFTLRFEDLKSDRPLTISTPDGSSWLNADVQNLDARPKAYALSGATWQAIDSSDTGAGQRLEIWWQGERQLGAMAPEDTNPELRKQLEALGYL